MADVRYAPEPRDILLNPNRQATVLFAKPGSNINISEETGLTVPSRRNLREKTDNSPIASSPTKKQNSKTENRDAGANGFVKRKPRGDKPSKTVSRPNARSGERKKKKNRSSKKSQSRFHGTHDNPNWVRLYCGCKWGVGHPGAKRLHEGVGWKRGQAASVRSVSTDDLNVITHILSFIILTPVPNFRAGATRQNQPWPTRFCRTTRAACH
jgi:hypothetical protein